MKRTDLLRHLNSFGCIVIRDQGKHTVVFNPAKNLSSAVPRHRELKHYTAISICRQLDIPVPNKK